MLRRWGILLAVLTLAAGLALTASSASAATTGFTLGGPIHLVGANRAVQGGISHQAGSTNWSGYAATTGPYTSVSASWTQPAGTCSLGAQQAAFWVGLDGYSSSSVEQTGSEVDCVGSTAHYFAWYEMYPNASVTYSNTVRPGDHFNASVTFTGTNYVQLGHRGHHPGLEPHHRGEPGRGGPVLGRGHRRGAVLHRWRRHLAADQLRHGEHHRLDGQRVRPRQRRRVTQIVMIDNAGLDKDTVPSLSGGENFSATWLRSN